MLSENRRPRSDRGHSTIIELLVIIMVVAISLGLSIPLSRRYPRLFASDLCPDPNTVCGVLPIGLLATTAVGAVVVLTAGSWYSRWTNDE